MEADNLLQYLQNRFPYEFEKWDGYQCIVGAIQRKETEPVITLRIYNRDKKNMTGIEPLQTFVIYPERDEVKIGEEFFNELYRKLYQEASMS